MAARRSSAFGVLPLILLAAAACAGEAPPAARSADEAPSAREPAAPAAIAPAPAAASAEAEAGACDLVCEGARVVSHSITPDESADYHTTQAVERANQTLQAMHDDLVACYRARIKSHPGAHAFMTIDIVVGPDGHVQTVETQGGALLGPDGRACIVERIKKGEFAPPPRGGTMRLSVPFSLVRAAPGETT